MHDALGFGGLIYDSERVCFFRGEGDTVAISFQNVLCTW